MQQFPSRYDIGVATITHKGKPVTTTVGSSQYERFVVDIEKVFSLKGRIPAMHQNRPDLIADLFYNNKDSWWYLLEFNNIKDPFEGFYRGDQIKIPNL